MYAGLFEFTLIPFCLRCVRSLSSHRQ